MTCLNTGNAGSFYCNKGSIFGKPSGIIFAKSSFSQTASEFELEAEMINAIQNEDVFPFLDLKEFEDQSSEATYHEYGNESRKNTSQGRYRFSFMYDMAECKKKEAQNFRQFSDLVYFVYENKVIRGRSTDSGVTVVGMRLSMVNVEKEAFPLMDGTPAMVSIIVDLLDEEDANAFDYSRQMDWSVSELDSLTPVNLAQVGTASATDAVIGVTADCYGKDKPISGLVTADFDITGTGVITSVTEQTATPGQYDVVGTTLTTSDVIDLVEPEALTADLLIKSSGGVILDVTP